MTPDAIIQNFLNNVQNATDPATKSFVERLLADIPKEIAATFVNDQNSDWKSFANSMKTLNSFLANQSLNIEDVTGVKVGSRYAHNLVIRPDPRGNPAAITRFNIETCTSKVYSKPVLISKLIAYRHLLNTSTHFVKLVDGGEDVIQGTSTNGNLTPGAALYFGFRSKGAVSLPWWANTKVDLNTSMSTYPDQKLINYFWHKLGHIRTVCNRQDKILSRMIAEAPVHSPFPTVSDNKIKQALSQLSTQFSNTLLDPICFVDDEIIEQLRHTPDTERNSLEHLRNFKICAVQIQKIKGTFKKVNITLKEYLDNYEKYITLLNVPKPATVQIPGTLYVEAEFITRVPTLLIPAKLLRSTSKQVIESVYSLIDHISRGAFEDLLNKGMYEENLKILGPFTKYWDGILRVCGSSDAIKLKQTMNSVDEPVDYKELLVPNVQMSRTFNNQVYRQLTKINENTVRHLNVDKALNDSLRVIVRDKDTTEINIEDLEERLDELTTQLDSLNGQVTTVTGRINEVKQTIATCKEERDKTVVEFSKVEIPVVTKADIKHELEQIIVEKIVVDIGNYLVLSVQFTAGGIQTDLFDKYGGAVEKSMLGYHAERDIIESVLGTHKGIEGYKKVAAALGSMTGCIRTAVLATTSPVRIYVDNGSKPREKCEVVVGGPYKVVINFYNAPKIEGMIYLTSPSAIFGMEARGNNIVLLKQHPHSKETMIDATDPWQFLKFLNAPTTMCFGDTEKPLLTAMQSKDLDSIRRYVASWITSAWTKDQWGRNYAWFPRPEQVHIDGTFNGLSTEKPAEEAPEAKPEPVVESTSTDTSTSSPETKIDPTPVPVPGPVTFPGSVSVPSP